jgi:hypothetical protein
MRVQHGHWSVAPVAANNLGAPTTVPVNRGNYVIATVLNQISLKKPFDQHKALESRFS